MFMYWDLDVTMSVFGIIRPMLVRGVGLAFLMAPIMAASLNAVPQQKSGMASSMLNIIMQVSGSIGIALLASVLSHRIHFHLGVIGSAVRMGTPAFMDVFQRVAGNIHGLGYTYAQSKQMANIMIMRKAAQQATVMSFQDAFIVGGFIIALAIIGSFFLPNVSVMKGRREEADRKRAEAEKEAIGEIAGME
jgi:DHA2 family multidrug resistance protein